MKATICLFVDLVLLQTKYQELQVNECICFDKLPKMKRIVKVLLFMSRPL